MGRKIDITEIVETFVQGGRELEVCATGRGSHEAENSRLELAFDSFVRPVDIRGREQSIRTRWLPPAETIRESVSWEESSELAKELFHRWVVKVRQSVPSPVNH